VENEISSTEYQARCEARIAALRAQLSTLVPPGRSLTLEIGCGHGHFLTSYAAHHPSAFCIGIDLIIDRVARAGRKKTRAGVDNLCFLQAEAGEFLNALPPDVRLADIFVLFPDPWPKRRHHKNRLIQEGFLKDLARRADVSARLCFRTDFAPYFAEASRIITASGVWALSDSENWPHELETVFQSRAESFQSLVAVRSGALPAADSLRKTPISSKPADPVATNDRQTISRSDFRG
jgi:tRNA (guanine-N7-)-methyltransferase